MLSVKLCLEIYACFVPYLPNLNSRISVRETFTLERVGFARRFCWKIMGSSPELDPELTPCNDTTHRDWKYNLSCWEDKSAHTYMFTFLLPHLCLGFASPSTTRSYVSIHTNLVTWKLAFKTSSFSYQRVYNLKVSEEGRNLTLVFVKSYWME